MREIKLLTGYLLVIVGFIAVIAANLTAIGVGLYDWAFNTTLALAAWHGFVIWLQMIGFGIGSIVIGAILGEGNYTIRRK
jgi:hypothetical protein